MTTILLVLSIALQGLTLDEAVQKALTQHPQARQASGQVEAAKAQVTVAGSPLLPKASLTAGYDRFLNFPANLPSVDGYSYNTGIQASYLLWDFEKSKDKLHAADASLESSRFDSESVTLDLILNTRVAFFNVLKGQSLISTARETLTNEESHLDQINQFVRVGTRPQIDAAKFKTQVEDAKSALIQAVNNHQSARLILNRAMGETGSLDYNVTVIDPPALEAETLPIDDLVLRALEKRPELASFRASVRGQELNLKASTKSLYPSLDLGASASTASQDIGKAPNLNTTLGLTLNWTLYDGGSSRGSTAGERANLDIKKAKATDEEQQVWQEIAQAKLDVTTALALLNQTEEALKAAGELLYQAEQRYLAGVGDALEFSDAQVGKSNAEVNLVQARFNLAASRAKLLRALGEREWK